jgi:hypothetical protein
MRGLLAVELAAIELAAIDARQGSDDSEAHTDKGGVYYLRVLRRFDFRFKDFLVIRFLFLG